MRARRVVAQVTFACLVTLPTGGAAWAQDVTKPSAAPTVAGTPTPRVCGAWVSSASAGPNRFAVAVGSRQPLSEVVRPPFPLGGARARVEVKVSLAADSSLVNASVYSSPDLRLNGPALQAARASRFRTQTFRCEGLAADYLFTVEFD